MGICEVLTIIFVVCKIGSIGVITNWTWFQVLMPEFVAIAIYVCMLLGFVFAAFCVRK